MQGMMGSGLGLVETRSQSRELGGPWRNGRLQGSREPPPGGPHSVDGGHGSWDSWKIEVQTQGRVVGERGKVRPRVPKIASRTHRWWAGTASPPCNPPWAAVDCESQELFQGAVWGK